ncbi:MAG: HEPN domain-containing protein [Candidatus Krumholzibacteria bacterium]|nr:HEPN domain-containing protein [Candidatus Krumholzibacteria bacterium]
MKSDALMRDYLQRCAHRLAAVQTLYERSSWADVVRESQEVVELALKALARSARIEVPRLHDVGRIIEAKRDRMPASLRPHIPRLAEVSRQLRRDRELAFYGSEDLTPSEFYRESDAKRAFDQAQWVVRVVTDALKR